jgi:hypothetical protein
MTADLGEPTARYVTDNRRRGRLAVTMFLLGVLVTAIGVPMCVVAYENSVSTDDLVPSFVLGAGLGLLLMGGWMGRRYYAYSGEVFELYEGGFVHAYAGKTVPVAWSQIKKVANTGKDNAFTRAMGGDVSCRVTTTDGRAILITGLTEGARDLAEAITRAART